MFGYHPNDTLKHAATHCTTLHHTSVMFGYDPNKILQHNVPHCITQVQCAGITPFRCILYARSGIMMMSWLLGKRRGYFFFLRLVLVKHLVPVGHGSALPCPAIGRSDIYIYTHICIYIYIYIFHIYMYIRTLYA